MSTNATIAIKNDNGTYTSIYLHWDGYPSGAGKILADYYADEKEIRKLLALGDLSSLGFTPVDPGNLWDIEKVMYNAPAGTYDTLKDGYFGALQWYCKSYKSRGETDVDAATVKTEAEIPENEYMYLWDRDNGWRVRDDYESREWRPLSEVLQDK